MSSDKRPLDDANAANAPDDVQVVAPPVKVVKTEAVPPLARDADVEAVCAWLQTALPVVGMQFVDTARAKAMDAATLLALDKDGIKKAFSDCAKVGPRIKLHARLEELRKGGALVSSSAAPSGAAAAVDLSLEDGSQDGAPNEEDDAGALPEIDDNEAEAAMSRESDALGRIIWVCNKLEALIKQRKDFASAEGVDARLGELKALQARLKLPTCSVVFVGNTGAGKSTLLNSLIGEAAVLPTSGVRACTATIIELAHDGDSKSDYRGEVEFISQQEWLDDEEAAVDELTQEDGTVILHVQPDQPSYKSWCKLLAVYGDDYTKSKQWTGGYHPSTGAKVYKAPTRDEMLGIFQSLHRSQHGITRHLGRTVELKADEPEAFRREVERYTDSSDEVSAGAYWPLVRQVRLFSTRWRALRAGTILVDAPGLNDNNAARDAIVKQRLRDADAVVICSNITRAVNDRTAKNLLGDSFRRQLLMDGQYSSLVFVATQTDKLSRQEVIKSLNLSAQASTVECARARNENVKKQSELKFYAGLREMAAASGEVTSDAALRAAYPPLPTFCVSSRAYQLLEGLVPPAKGARRATWRKKLDTELPQLRKHLCDLTLRRRHAAVEQTCEGVLRLVEAVEATALTTSASKDKRAAQEAFDAESAELERLMQQAAEGFGEFFAQQVDAVLRPQLEKGASEAAAEALRTAQAWGESAKAGGMHWTTFKATLRRMGVFRLNMNALLGEPVLRCVASHWQSVFGVALAQQMQKTLDQLSKLVGGFDDAFRARIAANLAPPPAAGPEAAPQAADASSAAGQLVVYAGSAGSAVPPALTAPAPTSVVRGVETQLKAMGDKLKAAAQQQQRDISRDLEPLVLAHMKPAFERGAAEAGVGSHQRRKEHVEGHIKAISSTCFRTSALTLVDKLGQLNKSLVAEMKTSMAQHVVGSLRVHYSALWDDLTPAVLSARAKMQKPLVDCRLEAGNALRALNKPPAAAAAAAAAGDGNASEPVEMEGDLIDVTAQMQARRAAQRDADMIDLDDPRYASAGAGLSDGACPSAAPAADAADGPPAQVKPEKSS